MFSLFPLRLPLWHLDYVEVWFKFSSFEEFPIISLLWISTMILLLSENTFGIIFIHLNFTFWPGKGFWYTICGLLKICIFCYWLDLLVGGAVEFSCILADFLSSYSTNYWRMFTSPIIVNLSSLPFGFVSFVSHI